MSALTRLALVMALAGCAVPELDATGAIRCGAATEPNGGCPSGFTCSAGKCCPTSALDGGACPTLRAACEGASCDATRLTIGRACTNNGPLPVPSMQCVEQGVVPLAESRCAPSRWFPGGYCTARCATPGTACANGQGVCVSSRGITGEAGSFCLRACTLPAGETIARCRTTAGQPDQYVCVTVPGTTYTACVPDCKVTGCASGQVCDERSRVCVFPDGRV